MLQPVLDTSSLFLFSLAVRQKPSSKVIYGITVHRLHALKPVAIGLLRPNCLLVLPRLTVFICCCGSKCGRSGAISGTTFLLPEPQAFRIGSDEDNTTRAHHLHQSLLLMHRALLH